MSGARISLRVQPRARQDELVRRPDGTLVARVRAPAIEGRANDAVCALLARRLGVSRSSVAVVQGHRSRAKVIQVQSLDQADVARALGQQG